MLPSQQVLPLWLLALQLASDTKDMKDRGSLRAWHGLVLKPRVKVVPVQEVLGADDYMVIIL
jgi:hypothetical protein